MKLKESKISVGDGNYELFVSIMIVSIIVFLVGVGGIYFKFFFARQRQSLVTVQRVAQKIEMP